MRISIRAVQHWRILLATIAVFALLAVLFMAYSSHGSNSGSAGGGSASTEKSWAGKDPAPAIPGGLTWFNVERPLTLAELKGKVVLLDFWTLGCINCQQIIPDLKRLEAEFADTLVIIGVHSGKYSAEHDDASVEEAIQRYGLTHPVVNDPDFAVWNTFGANAWPTLLLIDPAGNIVGAHAGEGVYSLFQPIVSSLVREFDAKGLVDRQKTIPLKLNATAASTVLAFPGKVLADDRGKRLFIADSGHNRILVASLDGALQEAIGSGKEGFADGPASEAEFRQPQGLALSDDGKTLYVADTRNHAIRAVTLSTGEVQTIAGTGQELDRMPSSDADAKKTALASPWDLVAVGKTLYIAMSGVHQLWAMDLDRGTISVFAGTSREGIADGNRLTMATLAQPSGITTDGRYLYWVDPESSSVRRTPVAGGPGDVETLVGTGLFDYGNTDGTGKKAKLQHAQGITFANGRLYISDTYNQEIRILDPASVALITLAGKDRGWNDGIGSSARFDEPGGLGFAGGRLYVADTNNNLVREVDPLSGSVSTLTLSNLSVAVQQSPGRKASVQLAAQEVAPGTSNLRVTLRAPDGYHLNSQAPSRLMLTSSNPAVVALGEQTLTWSSDASEVSLPVPVMLAAGSATVTGEASIYYCRAGEEALCFIQQVEITLPMKVAPGAAMSEPDLAYTLPAGPS